PSPFDSPLPDFPRRIALLSQSIRPECIQPSDVLVRIHALPEAVVAMHDHLALPDQLFQRPSFQNQLGVVAKVIEERALEHEVSPVDPIRTSWLLTPARDDAAVGCFELRERNLVVDGGDGAHLSMRLME